MYTLLIIIIYLAFISLGLPDSLLGSAWPVMHIDINVPLSSMGIISMIISLGTIISSLFSDKLTKRFGTNSVTTVSIFMTAIALLGFSCSDSFAMLVLFAIPYGLGAGAIDAALNNYVAMHYSSKHMSWLHCFWGVGTIISPFVMSYSLANSVWNDGYRIISIIQFAIATILLISNPIWKINSNISNANTSATQAKGFIDLLRIKGVPSLLLGFLAYCAAEGTAMAWSCTYLVKVRNLDEASAAAFASSFFIGITVGRFLGGFLMERLGDRSMIRLGTAVAFIGIGLLFITNSVVSCITLIVIGLGCAPIYPCIIHSTPNNFGEENSGAIIGIQMASAYTGSTLFPPLFGLISEHIGFSVFSIYILLFIALMIVMIEKTFKMTTK